MLNIIFINILYDIALGAFLYSLIFTSCLIYLMLLNYKELKELFFKQSEIKATLVSAVFAKRAFRVLPVLFGFLAIYYLVIKNGYNAKVPLKGKYEVNDLIINSRANDKIFVSDSVLTKIYIDGPTLAVLEFNSFKRRGEATYRFDEKTNAIILELKGDSLTGFLKDDKEMQLSGIWNKDTIKVSLVKVLNEKPRPG